MKIKLKTVLLDPKCVFSDYVEESSTSLKWIYEYLKHSVLLFSVCPVVSYFTG